MVMETSVTKILSELIEGLSPSDFESKEAFRKSVVVLSKKLNSKLQEGIEEIVEDSIVKDYTNKLIQEGFLNSNSLPSVPPSLQGKERSKSFKAAIAEVLLEYEFPTEPKLVDIAASSIASSKSISELRQNLRLWREVKRASDKIEELESYIEALESQITFDTKNEELIAFYKEQNNSLIQALTFDDKNVLTAIQVHKLHKERKGRVLISKQLGISEKMTRKYLSDYSFE